MIATRQQTYIHPTIVPANADERGMTFTSTDPAIATVTSQGQIRGIKGMLEKDAYCIDVLNQASAAGSALQSFSKALLASHIRTCVAEDIRAGKDEKLEELVIALQKMLK